MVFNQLNRIFTSTKMIWSLEDEEPAADNLVSLLTRNKIAHRDSGRQPTNRVRRYANIFQRTKTNFSEEQQHSPISKLTQEALTSYCAKLSAFELKKVRMEVRTLLDLLENREATPYFLSCLKAFERQLPKDFSQRVLYVLFYSLLAQMEAGLGPRNIQEQIKHWGIADYYSRNFHFLKLSLQIQIRLYELFLEEKKYDLSKDYARKSLHLAIYLGDKDSEHKMVAALYLIGFYEGVLLGPEQNCAISDETRNHIANTYVESEEIPPMHISINIKSTYKPFPFETKNNFVIGRQPCKNRQYVQAHYHPINKNLEGTGVDLRETIKKVKEVGKVHKYLNNCNFITLKNHNINISDFNQCQVQLTHRSRNRGTCKTSQARKFLGLALQILRSISGNNPLRLCTESDAL